MTTIVTKNGSGAPLASDLVQGELAVDLTNKRLYTEDSGGTVIELGSNPTSLTTGTFTSTGIDDNATSTAITIDSSQRVGIGTASPFGELSISSASPQVYLESPSNGNVQINFNETADQLDVMVNNSSGKIAFGTASTERMRIDSSGNVGIGTDSPSSALDVEGTITASASGDVRLGQIRTSGGGMFIGEGGITELVLNSNNAERMRIDSSGNVGIGSTSPNTKLDVIGSTTGGSGVVDTIRLRNTGTSLNDGPRLQFTAGTSTSGAAIAAEGKSLNSADLLFYAGGNTERMRIDSSGNVGIGTSSPTGVLTSYKSTNGDPILGHFYNDNAGTATEATVYITNSSTATHGLFLQTTGTAFTTNGGFVQDGSVIGSGGGASGGLSIMTRANAHMRFYTNGHTNERMRIDASGNLLVGTTSNAPTTTAGINLGSNNKLHATRNGAVSGYFNRLTNDGGIVEFAKDGTTVGSIGTSSGNIIIGTDDTGVMYWGGNAILPWNISTNVERDNAISMGRSSGRYDDIYATNGTIQTSDVNEKQDIEALSEAETRVAVAAKALLRKFRWKSAVEEKGDDARVHFGIIAQDLQAAFEAEGLDAGNYGMFIHSTWWEHEVEVPAVVAQDAVYETQTDEEGNEIQVLVSEAVEGAEAYTQTDTYNTAEEAPEGAVERSRMGVRYSELLAFIIAAI